MVALLLALHPAARALDAMDALLGRTGFDRLEALADELELPDIRNLASRAMEGKLDVGEGSIRRALEGLARRLRASLVDTLCVLAAPVVASLCLRLLLGGGNGALALLCRLACACGLARGCASAMDLAGTVMALSARVAGTAAPVLVAAMSLTGGSACAGLLSPVAVLCVDIIEKALSGIGLPLCAAAAAVAVGGGLSDRLRLDGLFRLICSVAVWGVRLLVGMFVVLQSVEGRLAMLQDSALSRALRQALQGMIPFIGSSVSNSAGALVESAAMARGVVGVAGMLLAILACACPVTRLLAYMLSLKIASAVMEPVAEPGVTAMVAGFGQISRILLALCAASVVLVAVLCGTCLGATTLG